MLANNLRDLERDIENHRYHVSFLHWSSNRYHAFSTFDVCVLSCHLIRVDHPRVSVTDNRNLLYLAKSL